MSLMIPSAMVLAAGLGVRMRSLDPMLPKPLVRLGGRALLDLVLDRIEQAGIADAVVNVHHKAEQIEAHLARRLRPRITISDERSGLLDTGGGVKRALDCGLLGRGVFLVHNADSVWIEAGTPNLGRLFAGWDDTTTDCLMLLADPRASLGYAGRGDFEMDGCGLLRRPPPGAGAAFVFAGVSLMHARLLDEAPSGAFSLNLVWNRALAAHRLRGIVLDGTWMHVGDAAAHAAAEKRLAVAPASS